MPNQFNEDETRLPESAVSALWQGNKIEAIKILRKAKGLGLKQAKEAVDDYIQNDETLHQQYQQQSAKAQRGCLIWLFIIVGLLLWGYSFITSK